MAEFLKLDREIPASRATLASEEAALRGIFEDKLVLKDVGFGFAVGLALGLAASYVMPRGAPLGYEISPHQKALYAIDNNFPPGKLPGKPEYTDKYYNMSQGEGDMRGPWNQAWRWMPPSIG